MDKYDEAIRYLTENPDELQDCWTAPYSKPCGCLFQFCTPTGQLGPLDKENYGCLTTVKGGCGVAWTNELTQEIKADHSIPSLSTLIQVSDLPTFARWQRRLDKEIRSGFAEEEK